LPQPKKVRIDFIFPSKYKDGTAIPEDAITKAMMKISDKYGGSTTLVGSGKWIDEMGERKEEDVKSFFVITKLQPSTLEHDLPSFKHELERELRQSKILITYHDVTEVT
jgi:hypothetical protein